jgi:hypothetical protein
LALAQASDPLPSWNDGLAGIEKGKPFAPDEGMKKILTEAAAVGDATAGAVAFQDRDDYYYANRSVPRQGWNVILRLYGPLEPWFDKTWRPGEIELQTV